MNPPKYVDADVIRELMRDAQAAARGWVTCWPNSLSDAPGIRMLRDILEYPETPDDVRSRALFDRIEARPLTKEQYRAVVVDERHNLVWLPRRAAATPRCA